MRSTNLETTDLFAVRMSDTKADRVFVSYAHEDAGTAAAIEKTLAQLGLSVSEWAGPGSSFVQHMNEQLGQVGYLLLLLSRAGLASRWVSREWMSALAKNEAVLVPILLEDCELPPLLSDIVYIDFRQGLDQGLVTLRTFFEKERSPIPREPSLMRGEGAAPNPLMSSRRVLRLVAMRCMRDGDLASLLFDLDIDPGSVKGESLHERVTNLLMWIAKTDQLEYAADWLAREPGCSACVRAQVSKL